APKPQLLDEGAVALEIRALEIVQKAAAPADELEQAAPRVVVVLVRAQMLGELVDPARQHRDLNLGRARVRLGAAVRLNHLLLLFLGEAHGGLLSIWTPRSQRVVQGRRRTAETAVARYGSNRP